MKFRTKITFLMTLSLLAMTMFSSIPVTVVGFTADSYALEVGDVITWNITTVVGPPLDMGFGPMNLGDQFRQIITTANTTILNGTFGRFLLPWGNYDVLWGLMYNNSLTNKTWTLTMGSQESQIAVYNSSIGVIKEGIYPRNETANNASLHYWLMTTLNYANYNWTSGPNGYDGTVAAWNGSAAGDPGESKITAKINIDGVIEYMREWNGSSSWDLILSMDLLPSDDGGPPPIPGFELVFIILALCSMGIIFLQKKSTRKTI